MKTLIKIALIAGLFLAVCTATAVAQLPGMPYMPYVKPVTIPANLTLGQNSKYMLASIYDADYLPYTTPTATAITGAVAADGTAESTVINIQGSISTTGVTVYIPATATGSGILGVYSTTITVPAGMTEDGVSRNLTLSWAAQAYTKASISITATLAAVGGTFNAKKLDINGGMGNDFLGVLLGSFSYPYNNAGATTTYQVRDMAGIPDRMFGKYDIGNTSTYEHNFIYVPVVGEDGNIWLNNNLGADYANISSSSFSPATQATAYNDYHAYGSLFQWGRCPDGHELISWSTGTTGTLKYGTTTTLSTTDTPNSARFIINPSVTSADWRSPTNDNLWQGEAGTNTPCPNGFRMPTFLELITLFNYYGGSVEGGYDSAMKFTTCMNVSHVDGTITYDFAPSGTFWSGNVWDTGSQYALGVRLVGGGSTYGSFFRSDGNAVRCIKN